MIDQHDGQHLSPARGRRHHRSTCCTARATRSAARTRCIKLRWGRPPEELVVQGSAARDQVRARRERQALELQGTRRAALSGHAHGRRGGAARGLPARARLQDASGPTTRRSSRACPPRRTSPCRRGATCGSRRCADILDGKVFVHSHGYRADEILMLMRRRRRVRLQGAHLPARARGLQDRERDRAPRCRRRDLHRLVGVQDGGDGCHSLQPGDPREQGSRRSRSTRTRTSSRDGCTGTRPRR